MEICSPEILDDILRRYGIDKSRISKTHDAIMTGREETYIEKTIYQCEKDGISCLLRIVNPRYIDFGWLRGEADWVNYLADNGVVVPRVIPSEGGHLVEFNDDTCAATLLRKIPGRLIEFDNPEEWNAALFEKYGSVIGSMHRLSQSYQPADEDCRRLSWHQQEWFTEIDRYVPASETMPKEKLNEVLACMHTLPRDNRSYGLIHGDAHPWNMLINDGQIGILDFDFCEYNWFAADIGIILFYIVSIPIGEMDRDEVAAYFLEHFLDGYNRENRLDAFWLELIPLFLTGRVISKYILSYPQYANGTMTDTRRTYFERWRKCIENDAPYIDIDFTKFA